MIGLGLGLGVALSPTGGGGPAPAVMRIVNADETEAYTIAPHAEVGATVVRWIYGNDGDSSTPPDSLGGEAGGWRIGGTRVLADVEDNPASDGETIYIGLGSQEYAINYGNVYGGIYHMFGDDADYVQTGTDLTDDGMVSSVALSHTATIDWGGGATADMSETIRHHADGHISTVCRVVSDLNTLTCSLAMLMVGTGFTRYSTDLGETWQPIPAGNTTVHFDEIWFRNPTTGTIVKHADDAMDQDAFDDKFMNLSGDRTKLYCRFDGQPNGEPLGDVTCNRTIDFGASEPDPPPAWEPFTITFDDADPGNPNLPAGFRRIGAGTAPATLSGGALTVGGGTGVNRWIPDNDGAWELPPGTYRVEIDYSTATAQATGISCVTNSDQGSTSGGALSANQTFNSTSPTTHVHEFTVPSGEIGYIVLQATTSVDGRNWTVTEMRVTGTPA